jgi:sterol desaturase/sphingolipid hydroxylase (fatty acid hydroxylase superfamily)
MMDLSFYYWHRLNHVIPFLWRFHSVHHIDPDMDVTTSLRFHFGEVFLSAFFRVVQVLAIGVAPLTYVIYELFFSLATLFHHSNIRIGLDLEKRINRFIVTPRMHGIHHSVVRSELNSNYSVIFRWWDALNRSLVLNVPQSAIRIGVGRFQRPGDNGLLSLILLPFGMFRKERPARPPRFGRENLGMMVE